MATAKVLRRLTVEYKEEGVAPVVKFEGTWNGRLLTQLTLSLPRALRAHKLELTKKQINPIDEFIKEK